MNISTHSVNKLIGVVATVFVLAACSAAPTIPEGAQNARSKLTALQADAELANRAPVEIKQAEQAVSAAEVPQRDAAVANHLVLMADRTVDIARARAETRLLEDQRQMLGEQRSAARLDSRTREADSARLANIELQRQIEELNARETNRGLVITLGDLMFAFGKSDLLGGATANLGKLAVFLKKYPDRSVIIEGHTDNVGSEEYNMGLSQRRADSARAYLVRQGVDGARITTSAMGKTSPIADNASDTGRQQNRRVEIIISNPPATTR